jgi:PAS domain S-box-containing protein
MDRFTDYVALITGASSGVGRALARELARRDITLVLVGRHLDRLEALAKELPAPTRCHRTDLTIDADVQALAEAVTREFGRLDYVIHSAGVFAMGRLEQADVLAFDRQYATNVRAPYLLTQAVLPLLRKGRGQLVYINSSAGVQAQANVSQYAATKHALRGVADSVREELNADGIRVLSVFLGRTATPMQAAIHRAEGRPYHPDRLIQPEEAAAIVAKLIEPLATAEVTSVTIRPLLKPQQPGSDMSFHDGVMIRGENGAIEFWDKGAEQIYGWKPEESVGKTSHALLRTQFPEPLNLIEAELHCKGVWEGQLVHTRRDGRRVVVSSRWELQRDAQLDRSFVREVNRVIAS